MPPKKNNQQDKIQVRQFKLSDRDFWCEYRHYHLTEDKEIILCAGGGESEEHLEKLKAYLKRKKLI